MKWRSAFAAASLLAGLVAFAGPALPAKPQTVTARIAVSLFGFTVARVDLNSRVDDKMLRVNGSFSSVGIAKMLGKTEGSVTVSSRNRKARMEPARFKLDYRTDDKRHLTSIRFRKDRVDEAKISPKPPVKDKSWVKLDEDDLGKVNDPVSSMVINARGPGDICNRTLRIFDGTMRLDLTLTPASRGDRLSGGEVTCRAGFKPVSGYRSSRSALKFLRDESRILLAFSRVGNTGLYIPVHGTVSTQVGTVTFRAENVTVEG